MYRSEQSQNQCSFYFLKNDLKESHQQTKQSYPCCNAIENLKKSRDKCILSYGCKAPLLAGKSPNTAEELLEL